MVHVRRRTTTAALAVIITTLAFAPLRGEANTPRAQSTQQQPAVTIERVHVSGNGPFLALFGAPASRSVSVTVRNTGHAVVQGIIVLAQTSNARQTTSFFSLKAGAERTVVLPVHLRVIAIGRQTITVIVASIAPTSRASFSTETSTYPWGLLVVVWMVIAYGLFLLVRRMAKRLDVAEGSIPERKAEPAVIDLQERVSTLVPDVPETREEAFHEPMVAEDTEPEETTPRVRVRSAVASARTKNARVRTRSTKSKRRVTASPRVKTPRAAGAKAVKPRAAKKRAPKPRPKPARRASGTAKKTTRRSAPRRSG